MFRSIPFSDASGHDFSDLKTLREFADWYRREAERAGSDAVWDARMRTAQEFEAEAHRIETRQMANVVRLETNMAGQNALAPIRRSPHDARAKGTHSAPVYVAA